MIRSIIFDWSGTLVDDLPAVWQATNHVFRSAGREEITLEHFRAEFCLPFKKFYDRFTPNLPMAQLEEWFHGHFRKVQDSVRELPHAREFLEVCRKEKIRSYVLTSVHEEHFKAQAESIGFVEFFERTYAGVWDKRSKILELLKDNSLTPSETLFVGDMQHDIETAKHGGVQSCAVLTGYTALEPLRASGPDLIVEHLGELREILNRNRWSLPSGSVGTAPDLNRLPIVTVGALIFNATGQVLMVRTHKWSNLWGIPGGKTKFGETSEQALRREVAEETGLDIEDVQFVMMQDCIHSKEFYRDAHFLLLNFTCRCVGNEAVTLNEEAQEYRWVPFDAAFEMPINEPTRILLNEVAKVRREKI